MLLLDLTKFYDYVGSDKLITDAELLGYPLDLLLLSIEQYLVSRYLSMGLSPTRSRLVTAWSLAVAALLASFAASCTGHAQSSTLAFPKLGSGNL